VKGEAKQRIDTSIFTRLDSGQALQRLLYQGKINLLHVKFLKECRTDRSQELQGVFLGGGEGEQGQTVGSWR